MLADFFKGFKYPFKGLDFIGKKSLFARCAPAVIINFVLLIILLGFLFTQGSQLNNLVADLLPVKDGFVGGLLAFAKGMVKVVLYIVELLLILLLLNVFGSAVASPFLDRISEQVEKEIGLKPAVQLGFFQSMWLSVVNSLKCLLHTLVIFLLLLPINFIPVVGSGLYFVLSGSFTALCNTVQYLSYPLDRRNVPFKDDWLVIKENRALSLGFGLSVSLLTCVPLLQLLLLPMSAVGGTLLFGDLVKAGKLPKNIQEKC